MLPARCQTLVFQSQQIVSGFSSSRRRPGPTTTGNTLGIKAKKFALLQGLRARATSRERKPVVGPGLCRDDGSGSIRNVRAGLLVLAISLTLHSGRPAAAEDAANAVKEKAAVCATCHGEKGVPIDKLIPNIWGQKEGYLYLQLRDFKSGARKNEQMAAIVADLEKEDMAALAAYFTELPWPDLAEASPPKEVTEKAVAANTSVGCTGCHLAEWQGDSSVPRLAGQSHAYLDKTIKEFRDRSRGNNPGMSDLMNAAVPEDLTAIAQYVAALRLNQ